jgi:hypothetical protein
MTIALSARLARTWCATQPSSTPTALPGAAAWGSDGRQRLKATSRGQGPICLANPDGFQKAAGAQIDFLNRSFLKVAFDSWHQRLRWSIFAVGIRPQLADRHLD